MRVLRPDGRFGRHGVRRRLRGACGGRSQRRGRVFAQITVVPFPDDHLPRPLADAEQFPVPERQFIDGHRLPLLVGREVPVGIGFQAEPAAEPPGRHRAVGAPGPDACGRGRAVEPFAGEFFELGEGFFPGVEIRPAAVYADGEEIESGDVQHAVRYFPADRIVLVESQRPAVVDPLSRPIPEERVRQPVEKFDVAVEPFHRRGVHVVMFPVPVHFIGRPYRFGPCRRVGPGGRNGASVRPFVAAAAFGEQNHRGKDSEERKLFFHRRFFVS